MHITYNFLHAPQTRSAIAAAHFHLMKCWRVDEMHTPSPNQRALWPFLLVLPFGGVTNQYNALPQSNQWFSSHDFA